VLTHEKNAPQKRRERNVFNGFRQNLEFNICCDTLRTGRTRPHTIRTCSWHPIHNSETGSDDFLCVLCVSAVKTVLWMDSNQACLFRESGIRA